MGVEESNLNPSNMMHASTHVRFGNALGMENLVCNRFEGQSAEFLLAMAELCSLPSETPPHYTSRHDIIRSVILNVKECARPSSNGLNAYSVTLWSMSELNTIEWSLTDYSSNRR